MARWVPLGGPADWTSLTPFSSPIPPQRYTFVTPDGQHIGQSCHMGLPDGRVFCLITPFGPTPYPSVYAVPVAGPPNRARQLASQYSSIDEKIAEQAAEKKKEQQPVQAGKGKKKAADTRWTGRSDKQGYSHPWLLTSLKGHTGQVLDMDFSSNGKYLASCAEEEPDPGGEPTSSSSECGKESGHPPSGNPSPRATKGLSRRQRKNRRRDDSSPPESKKKPKQKRPESTAGGNNGGGGNGIKKPAPHVPLKQFTKLNISERDLASFLRAYLLSPEQMLTLGYPVESSLYPGKAIIFKSPISVPSYSASDYRQQPSSTSTTVIDVNKSRFDVNAREFVPGAGTGMDYAQIKAEWKANHDSGQGSGSSSDSGESGENLDDGEDSSDASHSSSDSGSFSLSSSPAPSTSSEDGNKDKAIMLDAADKLLAVNNSDDSVSSCSSGSSSGAKDTEVREGEERRCVRCGKNFLVGSDNEYLTQERCLYHWGKLRSVSASSSSSVQHHGRHHHDDGGGSGSEYACCHGKSDSRGCTTGRFHVWNGLAVGFNGPFEGYARTRQRKSPPPDGNYGVYALDCEMCYTAQGLELTKITVIGADGRLVYDCFVRPEREIVDYNTRFSGITAKDLSKKGATKTLREVQNDLMGFVNADTILIGHGLENDLRALRIMHSTVIDTAVTFPHYNGLPYRRSLKSLTSCFLKRDIQQSSNGHNSYEDARACMELMLWRVRKDFRSILDHYHHQHHHHQHNHHNHHHQHQQQLHNHHHHQQQQQQQQRQ